MNINCCWYTIPEGLVQGLEALEISGQAETIQTTALYSCDQNSEKYPEDLRTLAVTQTLVKNHQRWCEKNSRRSKIIIIIMSCREHGYP